MLTVAALTTYLALLAFYELADIDTNIDTGNVIAIGFAALALVWLTVASAGALISVAFRLLRRR
jgi:hypothetical protein